MENSRLAQPIQIVKTYNITNYDYRITNIFLNKSVHLIVVFKDDENNFQKECSINLYDEEYANWGINDNYIHEIIQQRITTLF